jgi:dipeptide/tripeptide permease
MEMQRIIGAVILAIGVALLAVALRSADAPMERLSDTLTGRYSDETMLYFAAGIVAAVGGGLLAAFGGRK